MIEFFLRMIPPTATAQMHKVTRQGRFYDPPEVADARDKLCAHLAQNVPEKPLTGSLRLYAKWCFPAWDGKHASGEPKITRPDTDNLQKLLKDCMTDVGFWKDDALVAEEFVGKYWADMEHTGIYIRVEVIS